MFVLYIYIYIYIILCVCFKKYSDKFDSLCARFMTIICDKYYVHEKKIKLQHTCKLKTYIHRKFVLKFEAVCKQDTYNFGPHGRHITF